MTASTIKRTGVRPALDIRPIGGGFGAELEGIDLSCGVSDTVMAAVRRALDEHLVLAVRGQSLSARDLHRVARRFGPFSGNPVHVPLEGFDDIVRVERRADDTGPVFGGQWHMDLAWFEAPPAITMLYAERVPAAGGDTLFANLHLAWDALSDGMKAMIDDLVTVHSGAGVYAVNAALGSVAVPDSATAVDEVETEHPLVCRAPATGRPYLFVSGVMRRFRGMTEAESRPLIAFLRAHAVKPEFTCRLAWSKGTLGMWRNDRLMHYAIGDYRGSSRIVYRTMVAGDRPVRAR